MNGGLKCAARLYNEVVHFFLFSSNDLYINLDEFKYGISG